VSAQGSQCAQQNDKTSKPTVQYLSVVLKFDPKLHLCYLDATLNVGQFEDKIDGVRSVTRISDEISNIWVVYRCNLCAQRHVCE
jgi:hypothetical protein